jgi:predicted kinase
VLLSRFRAAGLDAPGNHDRFTPHMTLVKLGRGLSRTVSSISPSAYAGLLSRELGQCGLDELHLSVMTPALAGDYYPTACVVPTIAGPVCPTAAVAHAISGLGPRVAVVMRGVPGAGKSTFVASLSALAPGRVTVCSSDAFFMQDGMYNFSLAQLPEAHASCRTAFNAAVAAGRPIVVVDNTNVRVRHYHEYAATAQAAGYTVVVVEAALNSLHHALQANARCIHNVCHRVLFFTLFLLFFFCYHPPDIQVAPDVTVRLWRSWEVDPAAVRVSPDDALVTDRTLASAPVLAAAAAALPAPVPADTLEHALELGESPSPSPLHLSLLMPHCHP